MKTTLIILIFPSWYLSSTQDVKNEDVIGNKILTFHIELTNEDGTLL